MEVKKMIMMILYTRHKKRPRCGFLLGKRPSDLNACIRIPAGCAKTQIAGTPYPESF